MKTIKMLFVVAILLVTVSFANAQSDKTQRTIGVKTQSIHVSGTCSMDKKRIEAAANAVAGIQFAVWDEYTQLLTLKYTAFKINAADNAQKKIAQAGNDTEMYRADDMAYENLPDCCRYDRQQS